MKLERPSHLPRFSEAPPTRTNPGPDIRNTDAALALLDYRALEICGRQYRVPPISGRDGVVLIDLMQRLSRFDGADLSVPEYAGVLEDIRRVARRLMIPLGLRRVLWHLRIRRDPLRGATEQEIGMVLGFLFKCRTSGHVRISMPRPRTARRRATSRMN